MKITTVGLGYVGLSLSVLLSQHNELTAVDIIKEKVNLVNKRKSPIIDAEVEEFFRTKKLNLTATIDLDSALKTAEYIIIATPTDYDPYKNFFNTASVESVIEKSTAINPNASIIIKSTVPVGFTESARKKYNNPNIIFSPEFLREGKALWDNLYPSRIIVGDKNERAQIFAKLLLDGAITKDIPVLFTNSTEAEAVKFFRILIWRCVWRILMSWIHTPKFGD